MAAEALISAKSQSFHTFNTPQITASKCGNNLECRVCEDGFSLGGDKVPRLLFCGHTLCHACLLRLPTHDNNIHCPFDRQPTPISASGVWGLKKNFALLELLERLSLSRSNAALLPEVLVKQREDDEAEQQSSSTRSSTACKPPVRRAPKRKANSNLVEEALAVLTKPDDECDTFGRNVATELRAMNDIQRAIAKQQMSQIIFNGRMNQLSQYQPVYFNSSNCAPTYQTGYYSTTDPNVYPANPQGEGVSCAQPIPSPTCSSSSSISNTTFHNM